MTTTSVIFDLIGRDRASSAFDSAGRSADKLQSRMGAVGRAVAVAGAAVAGAAVAIGVESVKAAAEFQSSMEKIHTQAGASQASVESLSKSVLQLSSYSEQGPQALSEALYHLKSVGLDDADAMTALKTASDLAAVGGSNLEDTTNALAGAWRSGITGAQTFGQTAATVNAIIGAGNMSMSDLVAALGTGILPAARTFGVSLSSVGAALATMSDEGVPAEDAATRLKEALSLMAAPSDAAAKALASVNLTGLQLAEQMRSPAGLVGAVALLKQHLDESGQSASQQAITLSKAFGGGRTAGSIETLLNNLDVLEKKQKQINSTIGSYGSSVAAQRETASAQLKILESAVDGLGIQLGLVLLPPLTRFVGFLDKTVLPAAEQVAGKVRSMIPVAAIEHDVDSAVSSVRRLLGLTSTHTVLGKVDVKGVSETTLRTMGATSDMASASAGESMSSQLSGALGKINWGSLIASAIAGAVREAPKIGAAIISLLGDIDWTSLGGTAASALVGLAVGIVNNIVPAIIGEAIHHPLDMAMFLLALIPIGKIGEILVNILRPIPIIGPLAEFLLGPVIKVGEMVEKALGKMLGKVFGPVKTIIGDYIKIWVDIFTGKGEDLLLGLARGAGKGWRFLLSALKDIPDLIMKLWVEPDKWLLGVGEDTLRGLADGAEKELPNVLRWLGKLPGTILRQYVKASDWLLTAGIDLLLGFLRGTVEETPAVLRFLGGMGEKIIALYLRASTWLVDAGVQIIMGLVHGIEHQAEAAYSVIRGVAGKIVGFFKGVLGIFSPSKVFYQLGAWITAGLGAGISETAQQAISKAGKLAADVRNAFLKKQITAAEEGELLRRIDNAVQAGSSKLAKTMQTIGLNMAKNLLASLADATTASKVNSAVSKLIGYVDRAWSAGDITLGQASSLTRYLEKDNTTLGKLATRRAAIVKRISTADTYAGKVTASTESGGSLSTIVSGMTSDGSAVTGAGVASSLKAYLTSIDKFSAAITRLKKLGLRSDLLDQIIQMGPADGLTVANALLNGPASTVRQVNSVQAAVVRGSTTLGRTAADAMYDSGAAAGQGFLSGLQAQEKAITAEMTKIAKSMIKTIDKELKIASPSKVMHEKGGFTALGLALGMEDNVPRVEAAAMKLTSATSKVSMTALNRLAQTSAAQALAATQAAPALSRAETRALVEAATRGGETSGGDFSGSLYLDSGELLGIVQGRIDKSEQRIAQAVRAGSGSRR